MDKKPNFLKREYKQIINAYLKKLAEQKIPVESAYFFGSRAAGHEHRWSDLDLCIISRIFGFDRQAERVRLMNLSDGVSDLIEPHPYSPADFENRFDPLAQQIKLTGIRVA